MFNILRTVVFISAQSYSAMRQSWHTPADELWARAGARDHADRLAEAAEQRSTSPTAANAAAPVGYVDRWLKFQPHEGQL